MGTVKRMARTDRRPWSIARRLAVAHLLGLLVITMVLVVSSYLQTHQTVYAVERDNVLATAHLIAGEDRIREGFTVADPTAALQPLTTELAAQAEVDWVTFFGTDYSRVAHRDPTQNGTRYPEDLTEVLAGRDQVDTVSTGPAGMSLRALVPVLAPEGGDEGVVGIVGVGHRVPELDIVVAAQIPRLLLGMGLIAALGLVGSALVGRYLDRTTHGLGPEELSHRFALLDTALHNASEGMVLVGGDRELKLYNDRAAELLGLPPFGTTPRGRPGIARLADLDLPEPLAGLMASGREAHDELFTVPGRILVVNQRAARSTEAGSAGGVGTVVTFYDRTEVQDMNRELESTQSLTDALRAQTHEHGNRLHTVLSLLELGRLDEARGLLSTGLSSAPGSGAAVQPGAFGPSGEPAVQALLAAKAAQARERGVRMDHRLEVDSPTGLSTQDLVTVLGNLVDNALDAAASPTRAPADRWIEAEARVDSGWLVLQVADGGPGPAPQDRERLFDLGFSTKPAGPGGRGLGLALVRQTVVGLGGTVELALDSGTVFTVEIPLPAPPPRPGEIGPDRSRRSP